MRTVKRLLKILAPFKKHFIYAVVFAFLGILSSLFVPVLIGFAVDCMATTGAVDFPRLFKICGILVAVILFSMATQWVMKQQSNTLSYLTAKELRSRLYKKLQKLPVSYTDSHADGDFVSLISTDIDIVSAGLLEGFTQVFSGIVTILGTLLFMFVLNPYIALLVVALTPISFFVSSFIAKHTHDKFQQQAKLRGIIGGYASEMIQNGELVKLYHMEEATEETFGETNDELQKVGVIAHFFSALTNPATRFVNAMIYAGVALLGAVLAVKGALSVGELTSFLAYCSQYTKPFNEISSVIAEFQNARASAERIFALLDEAEEESDEGLPELEVKRGTVDFEDVSFSYTENKPFMEHFNLHIESGQTVALVGPTGCGKTTVTNLLMRFYEISGGKIMVDGTDIRSVTRESLRRNFGLVLQDSWILHGTVRENIAYGKEDATEEEILAAAKAAKAHSFIQRLPQGYDTMLRKNGANLSHGEKQLLCLARVMLRNPAVLILDEATSNIDTHTEHKVQKALTALMDGRTSLIAAHRLSTVQEADVILVMREGQIVESGTHEALLAKGGFYKEIYESQFDVHTAENALKQI